MTTIAANTHTRPPPSDMRLKRLAALKKAAAEKKDDSYISKSMKIDEKDATISPVQQSDTPLSLPVDYQTLTPTVSIRVKERRGDLSTDPVLHEEGTEIPDFKEPFHVTLGPWRVRYDPCFATGKGNLGKSDYSKTPKDARYTVSLEDVNQKSSVISFIQDTCKSILRGIYHAKTRDSRWEEAIGEKTVTEFLQNVTYPCVKTDSFTSSQYVEMKRKLSTWQGPLYIKCWEDSDQPRNIRYTDIKKGSLIKCLCHFRPYAFNGKYGISLDLGEDVVLVPEARIEHYFPSSKRKREDEEE